MNFTITQEQRIAIFAKSGFGKSTFQGQVLLDGKPVQTKGFSPVQLIYQQAEASVRNIALLGITKAQVRDLAKQADIVLKLKELGFPYVTLDLEGFRSGSMDIHINEVNHGR